MAKEKCKRREKELEKRRIARRARYKQIKNDPEKYAAEKVKKREAYLKRKSEKKVKCIKEMSPREQKDQRKRWKINSQRYVKRKTTEQNMEEVSVSRMGETNEDAGADDDLTDPLNTNNIETEGRGNKIKTLQSKIKTLKTKHNKEKREIILLMKRYQHRYRILSKEPQGSGDSNTETLMPTPDIKEEVEESTIEGCLEPMQDPLQESIAETTNDNIGTITPPSPSKPRRQFRPRRKVARYKKPLEDNSVLNALQRLENIVTEVSNATQIQQMTQLQTQDEFHMFALSVAAQLRQLPEHIAIETQSKIQSMISEARLASIFANSLPSTSLAVTIKTEEEVDISD